jgi:hypothetical protein
MAKKAKRTANTLNKTIETIVQTNALDAKAQEIATVAGRINPDKTDYFDASHALSNAPTYTFEHAVNAALSSATEEGNAEAEMVCSLFADDLWTLEKLESYFGAAKSQRITRDGKQVTDTTIPTRKTMEHGMLLSVPGYVAAVTALSEAKTALRFTNKQDETAIAKAKIKIKKLDEPILATRQMLHRAFQSLYACRKEGYINVSIGENGELMVTTPEGETKPFTANGVRKMGNAALKDAKLITSRAPRVTQGENAANISVANLDATLSALGRLIEDDNFEPPVNSDTQADKNALAETALRIAYKLTPDDVASSDYLRSTVSAIIVELQRVMGAKQVTTKKVKAA